MADQKNNLGASHFFGSLAIYYSFDPNEFSANAKIHDY